MNNLINIIDNLSKTGSSDSKLHIDQILSYLEYETLDISDLMHIYGNILLFKPHFLNDTKLGLLLKEKIEEQRKLSSKSDRTISLKALEEQRFANPERLNLTLSSLY